MATFPLLDNRLFLVGYSDDARVLIDHLQAEAPGLLSRVAGVVDDARVVSQLKARGLAVVCGDPWNVTTLLDADLQRAGIVVVFPEDPVRHGERILTTVRAVRRLCPDAQIFAKAGSGEDAERLYAVGANEVMVIRTTPTPNRTAGGGDARGDLAIDTP
ncbi:MAG: NAD-binding protein [Candidatus Rokubacteria bacterium]|nr:NAD-binding protein [Candidatus Rokubacteria bacterium]